MLISALLFLFGVLTMLMHHDCVGSMRSRNCLVIPTECYSPFIPTPDFVNLLGLNCKFVAHYKSATFVSVSEFLNVIL